MKLDRAPFGCLGLASCPTSASGALSKLSIGKATRLVEFSRDTNVPWSNDKRFLYLILIGMVIHLVGFPLREP